MLACIDVQSFSPDTDYATFQTSSAALVSALRINGACILQLSASDAEIVRHAIIEAKVGFQNAFGTGGTRTSELARSNYRLTSHKELFEVREHGPTLQHPAGAAAQEAHAALERVARTVSGALCRGCGLKSSALTDLLDDLPIPSDKEGSSVTTAVHYFGPEPRAGAGSGPRFEAHKGRGLLTLIAEDVPGLQVESHGKKGKSTWEEVVIAPGCVALLSGLQLEDAFLRGLPSSQHRVVLRGQERCSLAFKLQAKETATFDLPTVDSKRSFWSDLKALFLRRHSKRANLLGAQVSTASPTRPPFSTAGLPGSGGSLQFFVGFANGSAIVLQMDPSDTIGSIKPKIQAIAGYPVKQQRLLYASQMLEDGRTLAYYRVGKDSTIYCLA